jgi:hypothetical protein
MQHPNAHHGAPPLNQNLDAVQLSAVIWNRACTVGFRKPLSVKITGNF